MIEREAMYKLSYGLFMLTTTDGQKQNGCIVNTVSMLTDNPKRITVFVNKANYSEELLRKTGIFNVSVLTEGAGAAAKDALGAAVSSSSNLTGL